MKANAKFISVWDGGKELSSPARFYPKSGEIAVLETQSGEGFEHLEREYILYRGDDYEVCSTCHEFTVKASMKEIPAGSGALQQVEICRNPDCESHE